MSEQVAVPGTFVVKGAEIFVVKDPINVTSFTGEGSCNILHADKSATRWTKKILCVKDEKCYVLKGTVVFEQK
jgi:hypothetical protein